MDRQLFLFEDTSKDVKKKIYLNKEKLALQIITLFFTFVLAYVIGFKQGLNRAKVDESKRELTCKNILEEKQPPVSKNNTNKSLPSSISSNIIRRTEKKPKRKTGSQYFTIQLASYENKKIARWYLNKFLKEGLDAFLLKKGKYEVLYVGKFPTKEEAIKMIKNFKKEFKDCFPTKMKEGKDEFAFFSERSR